MAGTLDTKEQRPMVALRLRARLVLTLVFILLVVALLIVGGFFLQQTVDSSFHDAERIRIARVHISEMLRQQLDEETGVRGYAAVRVPALLASYYGGRANLPLYFQRVGADLGTLDVTEAIPALREAVRTNDRWVHEIAFPLIARRGEHQRLELEGKELVDRFRLDVAAIDTDLARRTVLANQRAHRAVIWVGGFAIGAVAAVVLAAAIFTIQQFRLVTRLERQRLESEAQRRRSVEMQAALETERRIADTLQEAFGERVFPMLPTMSFSAIYLPATEEAKVGGDWYDALQLPQDRVLLAIGDVTGHGIEAVVAMNKARQLFIAAALLDASPAGILQRVNAELVRGKSPIITAACAVIDTRIYEFTYACAGHPPPVLFEQGRARLLPFGSLPLGVMANAEYRTQRVQTRPGDMIVLYTDGVVEYSRDIAAGEAALLKAVESAADVPRGQAARSICDQIFSGQKIADDIAILTVRLWEAPSTASVPPQGNQATSTVATQMGTTSQSRLRGLERVA